MEQSFSSAERLLHKSQFDNVFASRKKIFSKGANLYFIPNDISHARLGVITSKRNQKHAVDRNFIRRHCREIFRKKKQQLVGVDIIILTTKNTKNLSKKGQAQCLKQLFDRLAKQLAS